MILRRGFDGRSLFAFKQALSAADLECLPPEQRRTTKETTEALQMEHRVFCAVGHGCSSLIGCYGVTRNGLVLEYADGGDLNAYLLELKRTQKRAFNVWEARELLLAMVAALSFLHERGIIHGNVKYVDPPLHSLRTAPTLIFPVMLLLMPAEDSRAS